MSAAAGLTVATWNMERKVPGSREAALMLADLAAHTPDLICLSEAYTGLDLPEGHLITSEADYGYQLIEGRRKVMLWSRTPWESIDCIGRPDMPPGRFVSATTMTALGEVTVVGVCIPWRDAHVRNGTRDRQPWEDHLTYLAGLSDLLASLSGPVILMGDFNQRIPRRHTPKPVHAVLLDALGSRFTVATASFAGPDGRMAIDHIAYTSGFVGRSVAVLSDTAPDGTRLSDHFGVVAELCRS